MKNNKFSALMFAAALLPLISCTQAASSAQVAPAAASPVVLGYVTSWSESLPDPSLLTHLNYAFGGVNDTFDGVTVSNPERLRRIMALKDRNRDLKILLSVGGWGSGRFSEMAADEKFRSAFAADCRRLVDEFGLDGIDIDWEYPTSDAAGISASPDDRANFTLLMRDIRRAIGSGKLLTLATVADAGLDYIDFRAIDSYIDLVNMMTYDMDHTGTRHHSGLYRSERSPGITTHEAVDSHLAAGVPLSKLVMGVPFYGRGTEALRGFTDYRRLVTLKGYERLWDDVAQAPWLADPATGEMVAGYDDERSLAIKTEYIKSRGLRGIMYWDFDGDDDALTLSRTIFYGLYPEKRPVVAARWTPRTLTLTNVSGEDLAGGWQLWYNGPISRMERPADSPVRVYSNGDLVRIYTTEHYRPLASGGELEIPLSASGRLSKNFDVPQGMFMVTADGTIRAVDVALTPVPVPNNGLALYESNLDVGEWTALQTDILPAPKKVVPHGGQTELARRVILKYPKVFSSEAGYLAEKLVEEHGAEVTDAGRAETSNVRFVHSSSELDGTNGSAEGYVLEIKNGTVTITATAASGAFYGAQTLLGMLKNSSLPTSLPAVTISDHPDFAFRGQHIDISRNYIQHADMLKLVDVFASYKLNVLHWHFSDDEGWRLEIPGLPELTEVGAYRGYTPDETDMLVPAYDGGYDPASGTGSGFLTRAEFIELLRYAARRHIKVVAEIESPGHARAARIAMNVRYRKYIDTDPKKAHEFLLDDFEDSSVYNSAQNYGDNVMNVALPSAYRFMEKVIDQIAAMYAEAGVPFDVVHIGGDEVPHGSWTGSPVAQKFMAENNIPDAEALGEYYILRVNDLLKARGVKMAGWQELVEGRSDAFRAAVRDNLAFVNCWSTNGPQAETPYRLANLGYPVVLSNVGNFYFDLAYSDHPDERGLGWGGWVDDRRAFSMQPWRIYASQWRDDAGRRVDNSTAGEGLTQLTEQGAQNILGLQGQLWSETLRGFDHATYLLFPKMLGLVERSWNASPDWGSVGLDGGEAFLNDYSRFNAIATQREMPWLAARGFDLRLPPPGICMKGGMLYANSPIRGAEIRYTLDGSTPTRYSALWTEPVSCDEATVTARLFYLGHESVSACFLPASVFYR